MSNAKTPALGDHVHVFVHPSKNGGRVDAPAVVTHVDESDGTVSLTAFPNHNGEPVKRLEGVPVFVDKAAAIAALEEHYRLLPGHATDEEGQHVPGVNTMTGRQWRRHDVLHWTTVAYWPGGADVELDRPLRTRVPDAGPELLTVNAAAVAPGAGAPEGLPAAVDPRDVEIREIQRQLQQREADAAKDRQLAELRAQLAEASGGPVDEPASPAAE